MLSLREKFSAVVLNLSMISLTILDTQTARSSAKSTNFSLTYPTGKERFLLLETSEEKPEPEYFKKMLQTLKETGIFEVISGLLVGKPMDETFYDDYKEALLDIIDSNTPIVYNLKRLVMPHQEQLFPLESTRM